jgi:hypothetical protein
MGLLDFIFGKKQHKQYNKSHKRTERPKRIKIEYNIYTYTGRAREQLRGTHTDAVFSNAHKARSYAENKWNRYHTPMLVVGVDSKGYEFDDGDSVHNDQHGIISAKLYENGEWKDVSV